LSELSDRFTHTIGYKIEQLNNVLLHREESLRQSSPSRKLVEKKSEFKHLEDEYRRVMYYKLERFNVKLPEIKRHYSQALTFLVEQKIQYLEHMDKKMTLNNPKDRCQKGWAQISKNGKIVALSSLLIEEKFILEDEFTTIEALCLSKS
jgi:exodeoxyribonuclease VII large subunit